MSSFQTNIQLSLIENVNFFHSPHNLRLPYFSTDWLTDWLTLKVIMIFQVNHFLFRNFKKISQETFTGVTNFYRLCFKIIKQRIDWINRYLSIPCLRTRWFWKRQMWMLFIFQKCNENLHIYRHFCLDF